MLFCRDAMHCVSTCFTHNLIFFCKSVFLEQIVDQFAYKIYGLFKNTFSLLRSR